MALPSVADAKSLLRIEDASEDTLVGQYLVRAQALIERELGYPLIAVSRAFTDYARNNEWDFPVVLQLPGPFKTAVPTPTIVDVDGGTLDASSYVFDARSGKVRAKRGYSFTRGPYTVTADIGLSAHPDYASQLEAVATMAILELLAHLYLNRNPATSDESDEGGASKKLDAVALPERVLQWIRQLPMADGMALA
jgi:uncharacterized phiE125 gp8 family phage protein